MGDHSKLENCIACDGAGWLHRQVPHPNSPGHMTTQTRVCQYCQGKGKCVSLPVDGRARAAGNDD